MPALREWLVCSGFVDDLQRVYWLAHRQRIAAFDDVFVVRYSAQEGGQVELPRHTDAGDVSFMIALSGTDDFDGGGTYFDLLRRTVACPQAWISHMRARASMRARALATKQERCTRAEWRALLLPLADCGFVSRGTC